MLHQPLLGAAIPLLIAAIIYACKRGRASLGMLLLTPIAMVIGAVWAIIPDLPRLMGAHGLYRRLATDPRTDIFLWHYTIDQLEAATLDRLAPLFNVAFALLLGILLAAAWRELRRRETDLDDTPTGVS
ncbi:MAG TPA: hypothetical protein DCS43_01510 [Verrucomicrobia bacterium]|nr:hypothetical protein [Verrucomicrobiota bacterium]